MDRLERFAYRLITVNNKINQLLSHEFEFSKIKNPSTMDKELMCVKIKFAFEYCWKAMKDYLKYKGNPKLLPRKIFEAMSEYIDTTYWVMLLDDLILFFEDRNNIEYKDKIISHYYEYYDKMFDDFHRFLSNEAEATDSMIIEEKEYIYDNHYILDTFTFYTLINYFRSKPEIKEAFLYGSRNQNTFRESSDVDIIVTGEYTEEQFRKYEIEVQNLRIALSVDIHEQRSENDYDPTFVQRNTADCAKIYDRADFMII